MTTAVIWHGPGHILCFLLLDQQITLNVLLTPTDWKCFVQLHPIIQLNSHSGTTTGAQVIVLEAECPLSASRNHNLSQEMEGKQVFNFTFLSHSIPNLGNNHNMTDGFLVGFGQNTFQLLRVNVGGVFFLFVFFMWFIWKFDKDLISSWGYKLEWRLDFLKKEKKNTLFLSRYY